jgi:alpha-tubulin suppressor-like RCC1 family protein
MTEGHAKRYKAFLAWDLSKNHEPSPTISTRGSLATSHPQDPLDRSPTERISVYVFGGSYSGELGIGTKSCTKVPCSQLQTKILAGFVGFVLVAVGRMYCAALTHDNMILTWLVNDHSAFGRNTGWKEGLAEIDDSIVVVSPGTAVTLA